MSIDQELGQVKWLVEQILATDEQARNSDKYLIWKIMSRFTEIPFEVFLNMPSMESIRRTRQIIQNKEGRYPPTDSEVMAKRKVREQEIREWVK